MPSETDKDRLERLIQELSEAIAAGDYARKEALIEELANFSSYDEALNEAASNAVQNATLADITSAVNDLETIAEGLQDAKEALKQSLASAQSGQKALLIPRLADASQRLLKEAQTLKREIDALISQGGDADN